MMHNQIVIFIVSDSIGETAEQVVRAVLGQFKGNDYVLKRYAFTDTEDKIYNLIDEADEQNAVVAFTIVVPELRNLMVEECESRGVVYNDILSPMIGTFKRAIGTEPLNQPGTIRRLDDKYFKKVEAIEFAVKYDDGKDPRGIKKADIVLIGVSRTSKTPLSMYLAHKNIRVANIPLVPEVPVPDELFEISSKRIIGLITDPEKLNAIRLERLKSMGLSNSAVYADMNRIMEELEYAEKLMRKIGCPFIDVSNKAIEESANTIIQIMKETNIY
ncbi:MAG: kinase/pyrophosphorylase [Peptostreptococcaceae bacterium]|nr:kinase/pyrophosphorylase [Peptostreptococcaceae bacterium]